MKVELSRLHPSDRDQVVRLFARYPFKTWQKRVQAIDPERLGQLLWDLVEPHTSRPHSSAWVARRSAAGEAMALGILESHGWHSETFGHAMGRISQWVNYIAPREVGPALIERLLDDARQAGIEHLACRIDGQDWPDIHLLEANGFRCVDCSLKMARPLDGWVEENPGPRLAIEVRPYEPTDLAAVQHIAARSHTHNHFYNDPGLRREQAAALFQEWVRRCASGKAASLLVAVDADNQVVGFVTIMENATLARVVGVSVGIIDYIVVDNRVSGRGIGRALLEAALRHMAPRHQWAELRTSHDNYRAVTFYAAAGFRIIGSDFVFHRWEPDPITQKARATR